MRRRPRQRQRNQRVTDLPACLWHCLFNILRPKRNRRHFADDIFKCIFLNENVLLAIKISLEFIPNGPIKSISALGQIMAWRRPGHKPLSEPMLRSLLTHTCVTRPHWVNGCNEICTLCNMVWVNLNIQELQEIHYYVYWCTGAFWCQDIYNHHNGIAWAVRFTHNGSLLHGPLA